jgi:hypothetical protein
MCDWNQLTIDTVKELQRGSDHNASFSLEYDILPLFKQKYPLVVIDYNIEKTKKSVEKVLSGSGHFKRMNDGAYSLINKKNVVCEAKGKSSSSSLKKGRKKKPLSQWCHQCKQKHNEIVYCSKFFSGSCTKKYCKGCIERHYNETYDNICKDKWVCLFCRNLCVCAFCRRKRGEDVPKKVTKRKKSDIKESPPTSPNKKKVKRSHKKAEKEVVLSSPLNSPISPTIPVVLPSNEVMPQNIKVEIKKEENLNIPKEIKMENAIIEPLIAPQKEMKMENRSVESLFIPQKIKMEVDSISESNEISRSECDIDMNNISVNMDVSLSQLIKHHFIKNGDSIVFIQKTIFTGVILENGYIKLGWCDMLVPNIASFIECCGVEYSMECLDSIYCNGETLKRYILTFNQLYPNALSNETYSDRSYIHLDFQIEENIIYCGDQTMLGLDSEYHYLDIPKEYILDNIFDDSDNNQIYI